MLGTEELEPGNLLEWNKGRTGMSTQCLSQFSQFHSDSRKRRYVGEALAINSGGYQGHAH